VPPLHRQLTTIPVPAEDLDGRLGDQTAVSPATSFDIDPSARVNGLPYRAIQAARQVSRRAASTEACMSTSMNATP